MEIKRDKITFKRVTSLIISLSMIMALIGGIWQTSVTAYDTQTNSNSQTTTYEYDYNNRITCQTIYLNGVAYTYNYKYDRMGNLIYASQPNGNWISREYDFKNRLVEENSSDGNYSIYTYYKNDKLKTITTPKGITSYEYYANGQLKKVSYPNGDVNEYRYDADGDLFQEKVNGQTRTYNRDQRGLVVSYVDGNGYIYKYTYTPDGLIDTVKLPNGILTDYNYKPGLLVDKINTINKDGEQLYNNIYEHNKRDFVTYVNENGREYSYEYDFRKQLNYVETSAGDIRLYTYDNTGNRKTRSVIISGKVYNNNELIDIEALVKMVANISDEEVEDIYAAIDQIVNGGDNLSIEQHRNLFTLIREVGKGYTVLGTTWTYNGLNQITNEENNILKEKYSYQHDYSGNMTSNGRNQYSWNAKDLIEQVLFLDGSGEKYEYDARGRRIKKIQFDNQKNTLLEINYHYRGDSWKIDKETNEQDNILMEYDYGYLDMPLSVTYKGETFWYIYNDHRDVVALTDIDGEIAARYEYDEWGLTKMYNRSGEIVNEGNGWIEDVNAGNDNKNQGITEENGLIVEEEVIIEQLKEEVTADITTELVKENPYRYAGYYFDQETQLYYLQARYYDPKIGRFITLSSSRGSLYTPLSLNRYLYTTNNPVNYINPSGI